MPAPETAGQLVGVRSGLMPADLQPRVPAQRLPTLEPQDREKRGIASHLRRGALALVTLAGAALAVLALQKIGLATIAGDLINSSPTFVLLGLAVMCSAMIMRSFSWHSILRAALPKARVKVGDAMQGTMIGVLMSSTLPARLGEPARALVVSRRTGRPREHLPIVLGTLVSQTFLNIVALIILGAVMFSSVDFFSGHENALVIAAVLPTVLLVVVLLAPIVLRYGPGGTRFQRARKAMENVQSALVRVRTGLAVFRDPRLGVSAAVFQLSAWALQWFSCYLLLIALGLSHQAGLAAAAAVLFAVNVSAVLPATPANLGVFQAACATVLHAGWHVGIATGVAYGVILQAVEVATAILMGMPALLKEGMSWREVRLRAMHATPIKLPPRPAAPSRPGGSLEIDA
jgi:phosphatidylinositol alpha-mannosyltransferase